MNFSRFRALSFCLVSFVATAAYAVEQLPEKEEDIPVEFIPRLDNTVSVGMHRVTKGPKVKFGNLGSIRQSFGVSTDSTDTVSRVYSNGGIYKDALTTSELYNPNSGDTTTTAQIPVGYKGNNTGGTYVENIASTNAAGDVNGVVTYYTAQQAYTSTTTDNGDGTSTTTYALSYSDDGTTAILQTYADGTTRPASTLKTLAYKEGQTRYWNVNSASQIDTTNQTVSMSNYGAKSAGASIEVNADASSGFELSWDHRLVERGHLELGFSGGLSLTSINAKVSGVVQAYLLKTTDVYKMVDTGLNTKLINGGTDSSGATIATTQPGNALSLPLLDKEGNPMSQYVDTTTLPNTTISGSDQSLVTPLLNTPIKQGNVGDIAGLVDVQGYWQIKGAYYNMQFGPTFRYRFNDRWAVSGGAGLVVGYVGTVFRVTEQFDVADSSTTVSVKEENTTHKFVPGYYGNLNCEFWVTERTGFYVGLSYQKMREFTQTPLSERTAKIDLGSSAGWRLGIVTRF